MLQLKSRGFIDYNIISIYMSQDKGNSSSVKFGGWDTNAMIFPGTPYMLKTIDDQSWALQMNNFRFTTITSEWKFSLTPKILFEPSLPFIYIPDGDFMNIVENL